jgi:hypothetical protein
MFSGRKTTFPKVIERGEGALGYKPEWQIAIP